MEICKLIQAVCQSSSLPAEGTLPNDVADQGENNTKADRKEDSVVGK